VSTFDAMFFVGHCVTPSPRVSVRVNDLKIWICSINSHVPFPQGFGGVGHGQELSTLRYVTEGQTDCLQRSEQRKLIFMVFNQKILTGYVARMGTENFSHCTRKALR
jgi:hypothetical protein